MYKAASYVSPSPSCPYHAQHALQTCRQGQHARQRTGRVAGEKAVPGLEQQRRLQPRAERDPEPAEDDLVLRARLLFVAGEPRREGAEQVAGGVREEEGERERGAEREEEKGFEEGWEERGGRGAGREGEDGERGVREVRVVQERVVLI